VADWLDAYATIMDLDIWTGADASDPNMTRRLARGDYRSFAEDGG
jgi:hypothetical protein